MASKKITITVRIWRQAGPDAEGRFEEHRLEEINTDMSFL